ncbi:protein Cep89 homolog [Culicoides brevitarsis]|uniref:protein Cep89 homolog n=1 Tax=Culicoides brevitarsis TaxID=469753 RepID=UPI00307C2189
MTSKIPVMTSRKGMFRQITDLDEITEDKSNDSSKKSVAPIKPVRGDKKLLMSLAGNFVGSGLGKRSRSSEGFRITDKRNVKQLLEIKDEQIEKLVEKLSSLIEVNRQFAKENDRLVGDRTKMIEIMQEQGTRLKELEGEGCEECKKLKQELEEVKKSFEKCGKENIDLKNDVKMLKVLVYRLNIQIERYQEFYREQKVKSGDKLFMIDFQKQSETTCEYNWGSINSGVLAPLLNAYEELINEKIDIISTFEREMSEFTGKLKNVLTENENLRKSVEELQQGNEMWRNERERLQAAADLYRNKADVQGKRADLGKEKLVEVIRVYEQKVQSQSLDIERLQEAYSRCKGELAGMKHLHEKPESVVESLRECQKLFEELKQNHDKEKIKMTENLNALTEKCETYQEKLEKVQEENRGLKTSLEKEKEAHILLAEKYSGLKTNIHRIRQSKEMLRTRLKAVIAWGKNLEDGKGKVQANWNDLNQVEMLLAQKQSQVQAIQAKHRSEVDELQRKLKSREETLHKILKEKTERRAAKAKN